ncbi:MAG: thiolase family protein [Acidobacteriota bacterium]|nr:thiolase family protein [Acidobacteriota bacterium]MDH3785132.1 thiolase family protein [Acidobacteriota bacterium]
MRFESSYVPYGGYWSTPFCKWQGNLANVHAISLAAQATRHALEQRKISAEVFDSIVLGTTVPQKSGMYGGPWLSALIGNDKISGTMVSQACATGARALATAAGEVETSGSRSVLSVTADRCSNGPHIYYPNPAGPGGTGQKEDWVMDSFGNDPWARNAMLQTAENVAKESEISREEQDRCTLIRYNQYKDALADNRAFQNRYMISPFEVKDARGRKTLASVETDEGVFETSADGLAALRPVMPDGTVTFGSQTHPADGNCGIVVSTREQAKELSRDDKIEVQLVSYGQGRTKKGFMAKATVPAARAALDSAGIGIKDVSVVKTHNPFAVNDIYFAREMGLEIEGFNRFGSSLVFGHPQGPTGTRLVIEMIEELAMNGGGHGLFVGCAAGDTAAAVVVKVN